MPEHPGFDLNQQWSSDGPSAYWLGPVQWLLTRATKPAAGKRPPFQQTMG